LGLNLIRVSNWSREVWTDTWQDAKEKGSIRDESKFIEARMRPDGSLILAWLMQIDFKSGGFV